MNQEKFSLLLGLIKAKIVAEKEENEMKKRGLKSSISLENQLLITLYYLRDYMTHLKLGDHFEISESYSCKIFTKMNKYMLKVLNLPKKTDLKSMDLSQVIIDVSEQKIERPLKNQKDFYSGKQKTHTMKALIFICAASLTIFSVRTAKGKCHDFAMFKDCYKETGICFKETVEILADSGFQGLKKYHDNCRTPFKATKNHPLTKDQKKFNQQLAIIVENTRILTKTGT